MDSKCGGDAGNAEQGNVNNDSCPCCHSDQTDSLAPHVRRCRNCGLYFTEPDIWGSQSVLSPVSSKGKPEANETGTAQARTVKRLCSSGYANGFVDHSISIGDDVFYAYCVDGRIVGFVRDDSWKVERVADIPSDDTGADTDRS